MIVNILPITPSCINKMFSISMDCHSGDALSYNNPFASYAEMFEFEPRQNLVVKSSCEFHESLEITIINEGVTPLTVGEARLRIHAVKCP